MSVASAQHTLHISKVCKVHFAMPKSHTVWYAASSHSASDVETHMAVISEATSERRAGSAPSSKRKEREQT